MPHSSNVSIQRGTLITLIFTFVLTACTGTGDTAEQSSSSQVQSLSSQALSSVLVASSSSAGVSSQAPSSFSISSASSISSVSSIPIPSSSLAASSSQTSSSTQVTLPIDQCNTTAQCRITYGENLATDCKNSGAQDSVCLCGNTRCDALVPGSSQPATSSSVPALNGEALYSDMCSGCHGVNGDDGFAPLNNDGLDYAAMVMEIDITMPKASGGLQPTDCGAECARVVTEYIKNVLFGAGRIEPRKPLVARLTKPQVVHSIRDIFDVALSGDAIEAIPNEIIDEKSFITRVEAQTMATQHPRAYNLLAQEVAEAINKAQFAESTARCSNTSSNCAQQLARNLGLKLFRRPLSNTEQQHYQGLFNTVSALEGAGFDDAFGALVQAMLQAPQFIYRTENERGTAEQSRPLSGYELASRLAFFLWQSSPDQALLDFAQTVESEGLQANKLAAEVNRLMADTRFGRTRTRFWQDYTITSTASLLEADTQLANDLKNTLIATLERASGVSANAIALQSLFTTQEMMLTERLAQDMGLASQGPGMQLYNTAGAPERTGFLSHPGFMANIGSVSFVGRGVVLTERVLCRAIPNPPSSIQDAIDDTAAATENLTPRQAKDYRFGLGGNCEACHRTFEPVAFAFERFDVLGQYTTQDDEGRDLFTTGYLQLASGNTGPAYDDVAGLMALLENSDETSACFVENMLSFASGRQHHPSDANTITASHAQYLAEGGTFDALVRAIALNPAFHHIVTVDL